MIRALAVTVLISLPLLACASAREAPAPTAYAAASTLPPARWDHRPEGALWTRAALEALGRHGAPLVAAVPADAGEWCPGYAGAGVEGRKAFWVGLLSALAKHESTWRPEVSGGGGRWHGLLQIAPATARGYGCRADSAAELKDGPANLSCGIRIMAATVTRDGVIAAGGGGVAADWGPFVQPAKRADMAAWIRAQPYCRASAG